MVPLKVSSWVKSTLLSTLSSLLSTSCATCSFGVRSAQSQPRCKVTRVGRQLSQLRSTTSQLEWWWSLWCLMSYNIGPLPYTTHGSSLPNLISALSFLLSLSPTKEVCLTSLLTLMSERSMPVQEEEGVIVWAPVQLLAQPQQWSTIMPPVLVRYMDLIKYWHKEKHYIIKRFIEHSILYKLYPIMYMKVVKYEVNIDYYRIRNIHK